MTNLVLTPTSDPACTSVGSNGAVASSPNLDNDERLFVALEKQWHRHRNRDLQVRHEMGKMLNDRLGSPAERQQHGRQVMRTAASRLETSVSDLYRMRWLADKFETVQELHKAHPDCVDWTKFKVLLPQLNEHQGSGMDTSNELAAKARVRGVRRSVAVLRTRISEWRSTPTAALDRKLLSDLQALVEEVQSLWKDDGNNAGSSG